MDVNEIEDRGDNWAPGGETPKVEPSKLEAPKDEPEEKLDEPLRDESGKFAKKDRGERDDDVRIPKSRFDEQVAKERERAEAAERRLAEIEARLNAQSSKKEAEPDPVATKVDDLEAKIEALQDKRDGFLVDGNTEKAAEARKEIRALERELRNVEREVIRSEAEQIAAYKLESQTESQRIDTVVSDLEAAFPVLRKGSDDFDTRMVNFVLAEADRLAKEEKLSPHEALARAGKETMALFGHKSTEQAKGEQSPSDKRKAEALAKAVDVSKRQPQSIKEIGLDSDKSGKDTVDLDPNKLTDKEFASLSATELAKMRGDFVEG